MLGAQGGGIFRPRPQHKTRTRPPEKMSQTHNLRRTRRAQHPHNTAHKTFEARKHFGIRTRFAHKTCAQDRAHKTSHKTERTRQSKASKEFFGTTQQCTNPQYNAQIISEHGLIGLLKLVNLSKKSKKIAKIKTKKMKKKWSYYVPKSYLSHKINDLREEYGIIILTEKELGL